MDSAKNITLNWSNLTRISDLTYHDRNEAGVYIWGFTIENAFIPYYVGIADNIIFRICEHINCIISGRYTIFHRNSLADFKQFKDQAIQLDKSIGKIYIPNWPYEFKNFLDNRKELQSHIDFMVDSFTFSHAVVNRELISMQDLKDIEKMCIYQIGKQNLINTRAGEPKQVHLIHQGNIIVTEIFNKKKSIIA